MIQPRRGEVWLADLGLAAKTRPVLVFNAPFSEQERALYAIIPHTTAQRGGRFEIPTHVHWLRPGAFDVQGLRPIPISALIKRLGLLDGPTMEPVANAVKLWLGL